MKIYAVAAYDEFILCPVNVDDSTESVSFVNPHFLTDKKRAERVAKELNRKYGRNLSPALYHVIELTEKV